MSSPPCFHLAATSLPRRKPLPSQVVQSDLLIHDPTSGQVHFLNPAAALIWQSCDGELAVTECADRLRDAFSIPEGAELVDDIRASLLDFRRRGLLEG
jgi:PqqD family protein of HPr-rel-A system